MFLRCFLTASSVCGRLWGANDGSDRAVYTNRADPIGRVPTSGPQAARLAARRSDVRAADHRAARDPVVPAVELRLWRVDLRVLPPAGDLGWERAVHFRGSSPVCSDLFGETLPNLDSYRFHCNLIRKHSSQLCAPFQPAGGVCCEAAHASAAQVHTTFPVLRFFDGRLGARRLQSCAAFTLATGLDWSCCCTIARKALPRFLAALRCRSVVSMGSSWSELCFFVCIRSARDQEVAKVGSVHVPVGSASRCVRALAPCA